MKKQTTSSGIALIYEKKVLLCKPWGTKNKPNTWTFPKGHVDEGESLKDAAIRECYEETDFDIIKNGYTDKDLIPVGTSKAGNKNIWIFQLNLLKEVTSFKCNTMFTNPWGKEVPEIVEWRWVGFKEAHDILTNSQKLFIENIKLNETGRRSIR